MTHTPQMQPAVDLVQVDLGVTGMTCTSCSARVERKLNKVEGVEATVNFATESASVSYDPAKIDPGSLIEVVRNAGYDAFEVAGEPAAEDAGIDGASISEDPHEAARRREAADLKHRLTISALLTVPIVLLSMIPALQFTNWQWAVLTMTIWSSPESTAMAVTVRGFSTYWEIRSAN